MSTVSLNAEASTAPPAEILKDGTVSALAADVLSALVTQLPGSAVVLGSLESPPPGRTICVVAVSGNPSVRVAPGMLMRLDAPGVVGAGDLVAAPVEIAGTMVAKLVALHPVDGQFDRTSGALLLAMSRLLASRIEAARREAQLQLLNESLITLAATDPLTDLQNRRSFLEALDREWRIAQRNLIASYLFTADIDGLKRINDTHGHQVGDQALIAFAQAISGRARSTDIVGRLSGDEFAAVLVGAPSSENVDTYAAGVRAALADADCPVQLSFSYGFAALAGADSVSALLEQADERLYAAKGRAPGAVRAGASVAQREPRGAPGSAGAKPHGSESSNGTGGPSRSRSRPE